MSDSAPRRRSRASAGLPPITAEKIIDAAVELTGERGLDGWSIRQIATRLDVWPGVIAHHVGDREAVVMGVTDRVISRIPVPDDDVPWRDWFRSVMSEGRTVLREFPGVARRLCVVGPNVPAALPTIDTGIRVLLKAGFGAHAPEVYRYLFNCAFTLVAVEDDRGSFPTARAEMGRAMAAFAEDETHPGLAAAGTTARSRSTDPAAVAAQETEFFRFTVERSLDGAEAMLTSR
ncbi:TetR/AcrR family transcriptional regulator [Streptomyces andamanensis]|uniref:TetR/AcrR family transcriptional regulator n=1 Tax=Streptomyces andamanensis TaxID=1565035 RepID=A0ABV8TFE0_9ACTN|nr:MULTISPECIES: TetR family transcriptional regulator [unclassified Streptomyces]EYT83436.1 TetR family transcriptional regulator [Streptomyces sp. Tu 6176]CEK42828.1 TetR-family transcriptional regulator [Streptomyces sp. Tu 6176]